MQYLSDIAYSSSDCSIEHPEAEPLNNEVTDIVNTDDSNTQTLAYSKFDIDMDLCKLFIQCNINP